MSREDWASISLIILGIILFLIGANYYNAIVGWLGVFLFLAGILALIAMYVFNILSKTSSSKKNPEDVSGGAQNP